MTRLEKQTQALIEKIQSLPSERIEGEHAKPGEAILSLSKPV